VFCKETTARGNSGATTSRRHHNEAEFTLAKERFDRAHDPGPAADRDPLPDLFALAGRLFLGVL
jgi:hypothetical protein